MPPVMFKFIPNIPATAEPQDTYTDMTVKMVVTFIGDTIVFEISSPIFWMMWLMVCVPNLHCSHYLLSLGRKMPENKINFQGGKETKNNAWK